MRITYRSMPGLAGAFAESRRKQAWRAPRSWTASDAARVKQWESEGGALAKDRAGS